MSKILLIKDPGAISEDSLPAGVAQYLSSRLAKDKFSAFYQGPEGLFFVEKCGKDQGPKELERLRKAGFAICKKLNDEKLTAVEILNNDAPGDQAAAFAEGLMLSNYKFDKYVKERDKTALTLEDIRFTGEGSEEVESLLLIAEAVFRARDLVNEPVLQLNAKGLSDAFVAMGHEAGFTTEVWEEAKIESQKMGGLLAVNKGSQEPPTFSIMEYKPANAKNPDPIVLVGKGVVFDTGGLSLKPTPASMDYMKCDMGGSAVVAGVMYACAKLKLPLHLIGLVPATDNRPGENAICPGDIITMYDGTTVEVMNTDAEGRLILGDALAFAKKYKPELVLDFATLTGAAARALGAYGSALMGNAGLEVKNAIKDSGEEVYERLCELPLWEEYFEDTKGDISDLKNLGKAEGGAQSAAMFLRHFTDYPWLHFDIAGTAFNHGMDAYRGKGATGVGVRLITEFLRRRSRA